MRRQLTTLIVRPAARGGKYLGPDAADASHRSALVLLLDPKTEEVVAHAIADAANPKSAGPANLMDPVSRSAPYAVDGNTVQVKLSVDISEPSVFRVLVFGPLKHLDQARLAQADITVLPGVDVGTGANYPEGLVIEVPGLCIGDVAADWRGAELSCTAKVTMMCGCPISNKPDWPWPDTDFSVTMLTSMTSGAVHGYVLGFDNTSGRISTFTGKWPSRAAPGDLIEQVWLHASEPKLGNQGKYRIFPDQARPMHLPEAVRRMLRETAP